jgi:hypothetical protein
MMPLIGALLTCMVLLLGSDSQADMVYEFTAPVAVTNVAAIERLEIFPAGPRIEIYIRHGKRMADSSIRPGSLYQVSITGARAQAIANTTPDNKKSLYENIKAALFKDLVESGELSGGTVK